MTPDYTTAHVTFFCKNHKGENIAPHHRARKEFIAENPMEKAHVQARRRPHRRARRGNEELLKNDLLMNFLGFVTMYVIVLFTYRSWMAGIYLLAPLVIANI